MLDFKKIAKMKILFVHNKYGKLSGEERMVDSFIRLLKDNNHEVEFFQETVLASATHLPDFFGQQ